MPAAAIKVIGILPRARVPQGIESIKCIVANRQRAQAIAARTGPSVVVRSNRVIVAIGAIHSDIDAAQAVDDCLKPGEIDPRVIMHIDAEVVKDGLTQQTEPAAGIPIQIFADPKSGIQSPHSSVRDVHKKIARKAQHGYGASFHIERDDDHRVGADEVIIAHLLVAAQ